MEDKIKISVDDLALNDFAESDDGDGDIDIWYFDISKNKENMWFETGVGLAIKDALREYTSNVCPGDDVICLSTELNLELYRGKPKDDTVRCFGLILHILVNGEEEEEYYDITGDGFDILLPVVMQAIR